MRQIAIITGGSKGIGAETARLFAAEGHDICISYLSDEAGAAQVVADCKAQGARAIAVQGDIGQEASAEALFARCEAELGRPRALINNAGIIGQTGRLEDLPAATLEATFRANVYGVIFCTQAAIPRMSTAQGGAGGAIVNMGSIAAVLGSPGTYVHYAATKAAVESLSIGAGKELGPEGIRVNAIRVGTAETSIHERSGNPDRPKQVAAQTPLGRIASPKDVAEAALWLASDRASFVTGTVLTVSGGFTP